MPVTGSAQKTNTVTVVGNDVSRRGDCTAYNRASRRILDFDRITAVACAEQSSVVRAEVVTDNRGVVGAPNDDAIVGVTGNDIAVRRC